MEPIQALRTLKGLLNLTRTVVVVLLKRQLEPTRRTQLKGPGPFRLLKKLRSSSGDKESLCYVLLSNVFYSNLLVCTLQ